MKHLRLMGFILPALAMASCGQEQNTQTSKLNYISWPTGSVQQLGIVDARSEVIKVCLKGSVNPADLQKAKDWAVKSVLTWQRALVVLDKTVTANVELSCDKPSINFQMINGNGRSFASGRNISIFIKEGYGTWTHELGHAYAALGDTYAGSTAGFCQSGQPQSLMCWGAYGPRKDPAAWSTLWPDDVKGVQASFRKIVPTSDAPEWAATLNPEAPFDVLTPWPDAIVNANKDGGDTELILDESAERMGSTRFSQAR